MSEQQEMDELTLGALALSVEPVAPPRSLRERILASAREEAEVVPLRRQPVPSRGFRLPLGAVAALVVVALAAGLLAGDAIGRGGAPQPPPAQSTHFSLTGHGPLTNVSATVIDLKSEGFALVTFSGLPELPPGKVYEVWLITPSNRADPAGVFVPDAGGTKVLVVAHSLLGYKLMAVTVEAGPDGVSAPSQQPQIYGTVT
jgi:anti-sigma-K factor RskA